MAIYKHLRRDNSQIRLVRVLPPSPHDTRLSLELRHGYIEDGTYSALSYVWGDTSEQEYILVNRVLFRIRRNLYQALTQLRSNGVIGWLWIDSLSIQQKNLDEKSYQVGLMREIFSSASHVYSWLGEGTPSTDAAMDFCARIGPKATMIELDKRFDSYLVCYLKKLFAYPKYPFSLNLEVIRPFVSQPKLAAFFVGLIQDPCLKAQKSGCNEIAKGLYDMMSRAYWTRIWINQEVALAKNVLVMCGDKSGSLEFVEQTLRSIHGGNKGHVPKDVVTLLLGIDSPIVLRARDKGGFTFAGDATDAVALGRHDPSTNLQSGIVMGSKLQYYMRPPAAAEAW
ncbi:heterokaryon incompatibility protein [Fusarium mundagurra]|uniref:Heterokaryon incompatibility protein n=1 Tax=Fusarium mundagurra TaxID=1567541 RepID=A0A8H5YUQ4_9HYPO|nr:heterokaryon incompatibility protein [Fusarium mundagurra]